MGLRALYGGRHLRTTVVLATTGVAAGAVTGAVGFGLAGAPTAHDPHASGPRSTNVKHHRHPRPAPHLTFTYTTRPAPSPTKRSQSPTPTPTATHSRTPTPTPTSAPPTSAPPSSGSTSPGSTSGPQSQPSG